MQTYKWPSLRRNCSHERNSGIHWEVAIYKWDMTDFFIYEPYFSTSVFNKTAYTPKQHTTQHEIFIVQNCATHDTKVNGTLMQK